MVRKNMDRSMKSRFMQEVSQNTKYIKREFRKTSKIRKNKRDSRLSKMTIYTSKLGDKKDESEHLNPEVVIENLVSCTYI